MFKKELKASLAITTTVGCRNLCSYCPQKTFIQAYKQRSDITRMSFETFTRCLVSVPKDICLSFSGFAEPWQSPECTEMVLHAHKERFPIRVNTTLIGMKPEDIRKLADVPFIKFVVHLPDNQGMTKIRVDANYLDTVRQLTTMPLLNLFWKFHKTSPDLDIHPEVLPLLAKESKRMMYSGLNNRAGQVQSGTEYRLPNRGKVLRECQDFNHNILLPNGDVALCHMDWSLKHILGNLLEEDYTSLHKGKAFEKIRVGLSDTGSDILCRSCEKDIVKRTLVQRTLHSVRKKTGGQQDPY